MDLRYEIKFKTQVYNYFEIISLIKSSKMFDFKECFQPRIVNSIYLDTSTFKSYLDSINGNQNRVKFRIRWYGNDEQIKSKLEIKRKFGSVGNKILYDFDVFYYSSPFTRKLFNNLVHSSKTIDSSLKRSLFHLIPTVLISYERRYFISNDLNLRITIDKNINYSYISSFKNLNMLKSLKENVIILETKFPKEYDYNQIFNKSFFPLEKVRFSKYTNAIEKVL